MIIHPYIEVNETNRVTVGSLDAENLAKRYGTPLYVYSENAIVSKMREYTAAMRKHAPGGKVAYASKAYLTLRMAHLAHKEGLWIDAASGGELYIAVQGGIPAGHVIFHGNNKTDDEIDMAVSMGVGRIVVDSLCELERVKAIARERSRTQPVLLRLTPGIDADTHRYLATGEVDSKFGISMHGDGALLAALDAGAAPSLNLVGFHCHIGSQIFQTEPFQMAAEAMLEFAGNLKRRGGRDIRELNLGGGLGVAYLDEKELDVNDYVGSIAREVKRAALAEGLNPPSIVLEPGRSIVAQAGVTLYTVGTIKELPDGTLVAAVDGGMSDNPRPMLYGADYKVLLASEALPTKTRPYRIVGKHCEEGDTLIQKVMLPELRRGDILVMLSGGAYQYSMFSNYNGALRPAVIHVENGHPIVAVERQTFFDLVRGQARRTGYEAVPRVADQLF